MPIKLIKVNIMSQLTSRGLDNTSSAFVSDIYIYPYLKELERKRKTLELK